MRTLFDTEDLPPAERLSALNKLLITCPNPMALVCDTPDGFGGALRTMDLAPVNLGELTFSPSDVLRTPKLIRQLDPEVCCAVIPLRGRLLVSQADRETVLGPQDIAFCDTSLPFGLGLGVDGEPTTMLCAHAPRSLLGLSVDASQRLVARPVDGRSGFGGLLAQFLIAMASDSNTYKPEDLPRLSTIAYDLMAALVAHHLETEAALPEDSRTRTLLLRIERFITEYLHDPDLTPGSIAVAHHISVGYLHRLFSSRDTTVAAWIRRQRLEHARRDLTDTALAGVPIHQIAARWGFKDHATFTRAFRTAYGAAPKDCRHRTANGLPHT